jgi:DNA polymerase-3 subunit alpha
LAQFRDVLEPGAAVLLFLSAEAQGDEVRARIQSAEPLDQAAAKLPQSLRVFLRAEAPIEGVSRRLEPIQLGRSSPAPNGRADGEVSMVLLLDAATEVEVKLPGRFKVSPQIAGAIKAVPGVVEVQLV